MTPSSSLIDQHVTKAEFAYLKVQRGDLDHLSGDFDNWLLAYWTKLDETFEMIKPHLPAECASSLDIGSGMGGIDILIHRHYVETTGKRPSIYLLDGENDKAEVKRHDLPFSNRVVALGFLYRHGVDAQALAPEYLDCAKAGKFDLIVSFAAWGFHIPIKDYLDYVMEHSHQGTVLIVDARRPHAAAGFAKHFEVEIIEPGKKYDRILMRKKR